ncbi:MAG: hypothetical protein PHI71_16125 [Acidiphilium sp.]|nr:hypothetical protein [Acidiphilium sp.]
MSAKSVSILHDQVNQNALMARVARIRSESVLVTPEMARKMRDNWHFDRQRRMSDDNIIRLSGEMKNDYFVDGTPIFVCETPDFRRFIVNGNHTLEAVVRLGRPYPLVIIYRSVNSEDEVAAIYANFDLQKARTWMDAIRASGKGENIPLASKAVPALGVIQGDFTGQWELASHSRTSRIEMLEQYAPHIELISSALAGTPRASQNYVLRASVLAVALETARYQPTAAFEFWHAVAAEEVVKPHPAKALWSFLRNMEATGGYTARQNQTKAAALGWNAAFQGKNLEYCKPNAWSSFHILGTKWKAGK